MNAQQMRNRIGRLLLVKEGIDQEVAALQDGLAVYEEHPQTEPKLGPGRPPIPSPFTYTDEEAKAAHTLHARGVDTEWVRHGERAYQRESKRRRTQQEAS